MAFGGLCLLTSLICFVKWTINRPDFESCFFAKSFIRNKSLIFHRIQEVRALFLIMSEKFKNALPTNDAWRPPLTSKRMRETSDSAWGAMMILCWWSCDSVPQTTYIISIATLEVRLLRKSRDYPTSSNSERWWWASMTSLGFQRFCAHMKGVEGFGFYDGTDASTVKIKWIRV